MEEQDLVIGYRTPIEERVARFLEHRPNAEYIPLHPEDYATCNPGQFDRPIKLLGSIGHYANKDNEEE